MAVGQMRKTSRREQMSVLLSRHHGDGRCLSIVVRSQVATDFSHSAVVGSSENSFGKLQLPMVPQAGRRAPSCRMQRSALVRMLVLPLLLYLCRLVGCHYSIEFIKKYQVQRSALW
mmetsp:Transcript_59663/g.151406  ORF Transcript_59663/g.151406 Transcript_59663/m.151406 type:complete len:116 (-) Transcript_59663:83-430(-)